MKLSALARKTARGIGPGFQFKQVRPEDNPFVKALHARPEAVDRVARVEPVEVLELS